MNMTEKFEHDRKDHTDKHERWNLTENVLQRQTLTGEYDRNYNPHLNIIKLLFLIYFFI